MVDDHIVTQEVHRKSGDARYEDDDILERSDAAYAVGNLQPKESKRFRKKTKFTAINAHVDGERGWASSKLQLILFEIPTEMKAKSKDARFSFHNVGNNRLI